ncbi:MAG: glycosyltransferase [Alphaproteobacteria bacterium]
MSLSESATKPPLVFAATYNERDNIEELCRQVLGLPLGVSMLVVDDNSPDGTGRVLDRIAASEPRLKVMHRPRKLGLGTAHMLAMAYAIHHRYPYLVTMDADFSHSPADIPRLLGELERADLVIGSRYMEGGRCDYKGYRKFLSWSANRFGKLLLGMPVHELTTSFRAFRTSMLVDLDYATVRSQGYTFFLECVWQIARGKFRCREVPIHFADRLHGRSKIPRLEVFRGIGKLLLLTARRLRGWRRWGGGAVVPKGGCPHCGAVYRVEVYPSKNQGADTKVEAYRCTSMEHGSKPQVVRCLMCGLLAAGEPASGREILDLYREVEDPSYLRNQSSRIKTFSRILDEMANWVPERGKVLEVGAYCGVFMDCAAGRGWDIEGVEPSRWAASLARQKGHTVHSGSLPEVSDRLKPPYQTVAMWDVFEHLSCPGETLDEIGSLLSDDGYLLFSTLDAESRWARMLGRNWPWIMDMHLLYPSVRTVSTILEAHGFEIASVQPYRHYASISYLFEKIGQIAPGGIGKPFGMIAGVLPKRLALPVYLGDVKLFVCRKIVSDGPREPVVVVNKQNIELGGS